MSKQRPIAIDFEGEALIGFLATCDDPGAMKALAARFPALPVDSKMQVLDALERSGFGRGGVREEGKTAPPEIQ